MYTYAYTPLYRSKDGYAPKEGNEYRRISVRAMNLDNLRRNLIEMLKGRADAVKVEHISYEGRYYDDVGTILLDKAYYIWIASADRGYAQSVLRPNGKLGRRL